MKAVRGLPDDEWWNLRVLVFAVGWLLLVLAATGVLASKLFSQPSTVKYLVTVAGATLLILLATVNAPLRPLAALAIVVAPFDFVTGVGGIKATPLLAVDFLALLAALPRTGGGRAWLRPMTLAFTLLLLPAIAGSDTPGHWLVWLALTVATGWITYQVAREPGGPMLVAVALGASALIQGALAIWEFRTGHRLNLYQSSATSAVSGNYFFNFGQVTRSSGALPDPIGLGQVLALCIPITIALIAVSRRAVYALLAACVAGVASLGLVLSLSRLSIVGGFAGVLVALVLLPGRARVRTVGLVAAMIAIVAALALSLGGHALRTRINSIFHPTAAHVSTASTDVARIHIWQAALNTAEANLVTGVGFGNITKELPKYGVAVTSVAHAHDTYLQFFAEGGVLGLAALIGLIGAGVRDLVRSFSEHRIWVAGASGALVATLLAWSTDVEVRYVQVSAMVAVLFGLICALPSSRETSVSPPGPEQ